MVDPDTNFPMIEVALRRESRITTPHCAGDVAVVAQVRERLAPQLPACLLVARSSERVSWLKVARTKVWVDKVVIVVGKRRRASVQWQADDNTRE